MKHLSYGSWLLVLAALPLPLPYIRHATSLPIVGPLISKQHTVLRPYSLPQNDSGNVERLSGIAVNRAGYTYGPPIAGGPSFPTGILGSTRLVSDQAAVLVDEAPILATLLLETIDTLLSNPEYNSLQTLDDYALLYDDHENEALPASVSPIPGILSNYTQDLFFSMERLSLSPYQIRRLDPSTDTLQFTIEDDLALGISGMTLQQLFGEGRLFYADYRGQQSLNRTDRYSAACDAFFYISQVSGDFLPLAIRPNVGSNLIYTPADELDDWLLAKIMYNVNDFWFAQWNHLAGTHEVLQIVYLAAIRTLSDEHPVLALLNRLMYEIYAFQPLAEVLLFSPGGTIDRLFPYTGISAQIYTTNLYYSGSGSFSENYFRRNLKSRGLIESNFGPTLTNFPFYEDASVIYNAIYTFVASFINSYYTNDFDITTDREIQAWVRESRGPAEIIDFPQVMVKHDLVNVITHVAYLVSIAHHTVNTNELFSASSTLPFHPYSLYLPLPQSKGVTNIADFLPPLPKAREQLSFGASFTRPSFIGTNRSLMYMFNDTLMLGRMNNATQTAATIFFQSMQAFSRKVATRDFDQDGLSQGTPFVWQALDPNVAPYSITV